MSMVSLSSEVLKVLYKHLVSEKSPVSQVGLISPV